MTNAYIATEFIGQLNRTISAIKNQHQNIKWAAHEIAASWKSGLEIWTGHKVDKQLLLRMKTLEPTIIAQHLLGVLNVEKTMDIFKQTCVQLEADLVIAITQLRDVTLRDVTTASDNIFKQELEADMVVASDNTASVEETVSNCFSKN